MKIKRFKTRDHGFQFRMGAGFPGDVNRTHPASIEPVLIDAANPPVAYGQPMLVSASNAGVRPFAAGDQSDTVAAGYGILVRAFPDQQSSGSNYGAASFGGATPPAKGVADVLRSGYIISKIPVGQVVAKGGAVYVWSVASTGVHVLGLLEGAFSSTNTTRLLNATFNGPADADGNVEIAFNI